LLVDRSIRPKGRNNSSTATSGFHDRRDYTGVGNGEL
jgi:hypothetical protein